jgi:hypothetical protein
VLFNASELAAEQHRDLRLVRQSRSPLNTEHQPRAPAVAKLAPSPCGPLPSVNELWPPTPRCWLLGWLACVPLEARLTGHTCPVYGDRGG